MKTIFDTAIRVPERAGRENSRRTKILHFIYIYVMLVIMGVCIGIVSLILASSFLGKNDSGMFFSYFGAPLVLILNLIPTVLLVLLVYFVSGRAWISFTCSALLIFVLSLINYYKIRLRDDPFLAADLALINESNHMLSRYSLDVTGRVLLTIGCFAFGVLFAVFFMRGSLKNVRVRCAGAAAVIAAAIALYAGVYSSNTIYNSAANNENINIWSDLQVYVSKGFIYPFIHSIKDVSISPPEGYNSNEAAAWLAEYETDDISAGKEVNIISIMLESYTDLSKFDSVDFAADVYGPLHEVEAESWSGELVDNIFAGGTIDTEREFLTGYTMSENYRSSIYSYVRYLREQGYYTEGVHAGDGWFYNRQNVNNYIGFDNYNFLEDYENGDRTDEFFFGAVRDMYDARDAGVPYFSYSLSYQNHGAYDAATTVPTQFVNKSAYTDETYNILNNYLSGIYDTTQRIADFVDSFRDDENPVVIIIFGDHMPWLGNSNSVYNELGINLDLGTEEGFYNYYSTPYFIWANPAAKEILGNDFEGSGGNFSPCFLMNELFDLCSWKGNDYMKAADELRGSVDIINNASKVFREDGVLTPVLSDEAEARYERFLKIEYFMKNEHGIEGG